MYTIFYFHRVKVAGVDFFMQFYLLSKPATHWFTHACDIFVKYQWLPKKHQ